MRRNLCTLLSYLFHLLDFLSGARTQRLFTASLLRENFKAYRSTVVSLATVQRKYNSMQFLYQMLGMKKIDELPGSP